MNRSNNINNNNNNNNYNTSFAPRNDSMEEVWEWAEKVLSSESVRSSDAEYLFPVEKEEPRQVECFQSTSTTVETKMDELSLEEDPQPFHQESCIPCKQLESKDELYDLMNKPSIERLKYHMSLFEKDAAAHSKAPYWYLRSILADPRSDIFKSFDKVDYLLQVYLSLINWFFRKDKDYAKGLSEYMYFSLQKLNPVGDDLERLVSVGKLLSCASLFDLDTRQYAQELYERVRTLIGDARGLIFSHLNTCDYFFYVYNKLFRWLSQVRRDLAVGLGESLYSRLRQIPSRDDKLGFLHNYAKIDCLLSTIYAHFLLKDEKKWEKNETRLKLAFELMGEFAQKSLSIDRQERLNRLMGQAYAYAAINSLGKTNAVKQPYEVIVVTYAKQALLHYNQVFGASGKAPTDLENYLCGFCSEVLFLGLVNDMSQASLGSVHEIALESLNFYDRIVGHVDIATPEAIGRTKARMLSDYFHFMADEALTIEKKAYDLLMNTTLNISEKERFERSIQLLKQSKDLYRKGAGDVRCHDEQIRVKFENGFIRVSNVLN